MKSSTSEGRREELEKLRMAWLYQILGSDNDGHIYHESGGSLDWFRLSKVEYMVLIKLTQDWVETLP